MADVLTRTHTSVLRGRKVRWHNLLQLVRTTSATADVLDEVRGRHRFEEAQAELEDENHREDSELKIVFELKEEREREQVPYSMQADAAMHSLRAFELRQKFRRHAAVREVLHMWWTWALSTVQHGATGIGGSRGGASATTVTKAFYMRMHCALYVELLDEGDEYDEAEALEAGEADFLRDAGGADEVGRSQFLDAIFELADIYVSSAVAEDYAAFLLALLPRVAKLVAEKETFAGMDGVSPFAGAPAPPQAQEPSPQAREPSPSAREPSQPGETSASPERTEPAVQSCDGSAVFSPIAAAAADGGEASMAPPALPPSLAAEAVSAAAISRPASRPASSSSSRPASSLVLGVDTLSKDKRKLRKQMHHVRRAVVMIQASARAAKTSKLHRQPSPPLPSPPLVQGLMEPTGGVAGSLSGDTGGDHGEEASSPLHISKPEEDGSSRDEAVETSSNRRPRPDSDSVRGALHMKLLKRGAGANTEDDGAGCSDGEDGLDQGAGSNVTVSNTVAVSNASPVAVSSGSPVAVSNASNASAAGSSSEAPTQHDERAPKLAGWYQVHGELPNTPAGRPMSPAELLGSAHPHWDEEEEATANEPDDKARYTCGYTPPQASTSSPVKPPKSTPTSTPVSPLPTSLPVPAIPLGSAAIANPFRHAVNGKPSPSDSSLGLGSPQSTSATTSPVRRHHTIMMPPATILDPYSLRAPPNSRAPSRGLSAPPSGLFPSDSGLVGSFGEGGFVPPPPMPEAADGSHADDRGASDGDVAVYGTSAVTERKPRPANTPRSAGDKLAPWRASYADEYEAAHRGQMRDKFAFPESSGKLTSAIGSGGAVGSDSMRVTRLQYADSPRQSTKLNYSHVVPTQGPTWSPSKAWSPSIGAATLTPTKFVGGHAPNPEKKPIFDQVAGGDAGAGSRAQHPQPWKFTKRPPTPPKFVAEPPSLGTAGGIKPRGVAAAPAEVEGAGFDKDLHPHDWRPTTRPRTPPNPFQGQSPAGAPKSRQELHEELVAQRAALKRASQQGCVSTEPWRASSGPAEWKDVMEESKGARGHVRMGPRSLSLESPML